MGLHLTSAVCAVHSLFEYTFPNGSQFVIEYPDRVPTATQLASWLKFTDSKSLLALWALGPNNRAMMLRRSRGSEDGGLLKEFPLVYAVDRRAHKRNGSARGQKGDEAEKGFAGDGAFFEGRARG